MRFLGVTGGVLSYPCMECHFIKLSASLAYYRCLLYTLPKLHGSLLKVWHVSVCKHPPRYEHLHLRAVVLHQNGIIHTDLKPDNIIFVSSETVSFTLLKDGEFKDKVLSVLYGPLCMV